MGKIIRVREQKIEMRVVRVNLIKVKFNYYLKEPKSISLDKRYKWW